MGSVTKVPSKKFSGIDDTSQFKKDFIKNYNEDSNEGYFLKNNVRYTDKLHELRNELPFLPERVKVRIVKVKTLVANLHDKTEYAIHRRN